MVIVNYWLHEVFTVCVLPHGRQMLEQCRQPFVYCLPDHIKVDVEIAMGHAIAHISHAAPRYFGMSLRELGIDVHHFRGGLADNNEVHDDGLLGALVGKEVVFAQPLHKATCLRCGLLNVVDVIRKPVLTHTGCASASTLARNFGGKSPGVSTST